MRTSELVVTDERRALYQWACGVRVGQLLGSTYFTSRILRESA